MELLQAGRLADREEHFHLTIVSAKAWVKALNLQNAAVVLHTNEAVVDPPQFCFIYNAARVLFICGFFVVHPIIVQT